MAVKLRDMPVGSIVKMPVDDVMTDFIILHKGKPSEIYDDSFEGGVILASMDIFDMMEWGSEIPDYVQSDISSYLNTTYYDRIDEAVKVLIKDAEIMYGEENHTWADVRRMKWAEARKYTWKDLKEAIL